MDYIKHQLEAAEKNRHLIKVLHFNDLFLFLNNVNLYFQFAATIEIYVE